MSAYIVSKTHIDTLVSYMVKMELSYWQVNERVYITKRNASDIGQILVDENYRSVNYRYNTDDKPEPYKFKLLVRRTSPVQIIKACHCLDYQSCETDDWKATTAHKILQAIISNACFNLPGYAKAEWEIEEPAAAAAA